VEVSFVALDPSTGKVRWEDRDPSGAYLSAHLYPYGVLAATGTGQPALLDWTTGTPRWTMTETPSEPRFIDNALPAVTWVEPWLTAPLATTAAPDTSTPDDPRLALRSGNGDWILDTRTGDWTEVTRGVGGPGPSFSATPVLVIGGLVYLSATFGRSGDVLYRLPADPSQPVEKGDLLWSDHGMILATTPCGSDRLCLTEGPSQTGQRMVLVDTASRRKRPLPDTVPTGGYAIGDRYVDPAGRVYDLTGALLGESSPLATAWWLTPGSLVGIDRGDTARTAGATAPARVVAVSTVDGRRTVLGQLPAAPSQVTTRNGYLVYADDDGFHAWQYAQP
jgi:outer membrane protein assembly factor BamB